MLGTWPLLSPDEGGIALSWDGRYSAYIIYNQPIGYSTLVIQDLRSPWKKMAIGRDLRILFFSKDSRHLCWQKEDTVWMQRTGSNEKRFLGVASKFSYPMDSKGEWVIVQSNMSDSLKLINLLSGREQTFTAVKSHSWLNCGRKLTLTTSNGNLRVLNLITGKEHFFSAVKDYSLSPDQKNILLLKEIRNENSVVRLQWVSLDSGEPLTIWTGEMGEQPENYIFSNSADQLAFVVRSADGSRSIWHYKAGQSAATPIIKNKNVTINSDYELSDLSYFSENGHWLFFNLRKQLPILGFEQCTTPVDIWSYRDETLNPAQTGELRTFRDYSAVIDVNSKEVQLIEQKDDEKTQFILRNDYLVLRKGGPNEHSERLGLWWPHSENVSYWLISLKDGKRRMIKKQSRKLDGGLLLSSSPTGKWLLYWDRELGHYFSINPQTGVSANLTSSLPVAVSNDVDQLVGAMPVGIVGWYSGDSSVLVYDNYDIWKLDISGREAPINITGGYGRQHGIKLRLVYDNETTYKGYEELLLTGYDENTKYNGFFTIQLNKPQHPTLLTMGPYTYYQNVVLKQNYNSSMKPLTRGKGKNTRWIVMRESATDYPNFYVSKDLRNFTPLTNLQPQKGYNWLSVEAVSWKMYDGMVNHGALYKPENFDSTKKYPVIFNYYEKFSQRCYQFPMPGLTTDNINIPWFVSRGYLVFTPDIQYMTASTSGRITISEAAYNAVVSAAEYLSQRPYIDKSRLAIQGHSFGGLETNNIISQTNLFSAAAEMAGTADYLSSYLTLVTAREDENAEEKTDKQDHPQGRMEANPWELPEQFRRNSPVLNADKVTTPLLIAHNKKDGSVNFRQGIEMFMALRRLGKPCWLLQYDSSGHVLTNKQDALDYTIRLMQYFDHYLKDMPAPQWMTMNGLAPYKGKNNLYAMDSMGNCSNTCRVCKQGTKIITSTR